MRIVALIVALVAIAPPRERPRLYHPETIDSIAASRHTHVSVTGRVTLVRHEADGDVHIRLTDEHGHFIVAEIVPYHPLAAPGLGTIITVKGIRREDNEAGHGWWEVHPVEQWDEAPR